MRSAIIIGALAAAAVAVPVVELDRRTRTVIDVVDVTTTVYVDATDSTPPPQAEKQGQKWWWNGQGGDQGGAPAPAPTTSSSAVDPPPAPAPATSSTAPAAPASAAPVAPASAPPAAGGSAGAPSGDVYAQRALTHHNIHRANNSARALTWDSNLASIALEIANSCNYAHNTQAGGGGYGQNIAAGAPADNITSVISDLFYNAEINNFAGMYGQPTPSTIDDTAAFDGWGHYTQIVWVGTTAVGCATVDCSGRGNGPQGLGNVGSNVPPHFTVCNYSPPGNYLGEFDKNVLQPSNQPTVDWSYGY